jgi:hypothetical protein
MKWSKAKMKKPKSSTEVRTISLAPVMPLKGLERGKRYIQSSLFQGVGGNLRLEQE